MGDSNAASSICGSTNSVVQISAAAQVNSTAEKSKQVEQLLVAKSQGKNSWQKN